jgi:MFS family permease
LFGLTAGQAVVWYTGQFYALFFLTKTLSVDATIAPLMVAAALLLATPFFVIFGTLSDRIGRKWIILSGCALAMLTYFPIFRGITHFANPALEQATASSPVVVLANADECSFQFNPTGTSKFTRPCDIAKSALASRGIPYQSKSGTPGQATIQIGGATVESYDAAVGTAEEIKGKADVFKKALEGSLQASGYPLKAASEGINYFMVVLLLTILVLYVTMVYGPIAAMLVEMFPTRIRYSSMSLPYHIGNGWFGGFLPATAFAIVAATGDIYSGLYYPLIVAGVTIVLGALFVTETKDVDIYRHD